MRVRASITVFSALAFWLIASFLFALLEAGRVSHLEAYADLSASLAMESVCAEYQPGLWEEYHLLGLDGAYGGTSFSTDYVTAVLRARLNENLKGAGGGIFGLELTAAAPAEYRLLTDGGGEVFLSCVADYMKENLPLEAAQILYDRYTDGAAVEEEGQLDESVESAQNAIDEAIRQQEALAEAGDAQQTQADQGDAAGRDAQLLEGSGVTGGEAPEENPLEVVLAWKQRALLGMVLQDTGGLSGKSIRLEDSVDKRICQKGNAQTESEISWYEQILALEYADRYFADYREPGTEHALSYELEYLLCGKASDRDNLEGVVERLLLFREAANVTYILSDSGKRNEALAVAEMLAGFTGNPVIVRIVQIGIIAAWAYVESVLDLRALLDGDRIALVKQAHQWTSSLGNLSAVSGKAYKAADCENGLSYQDYLKGFLFLMDQKTWAMRMMNLMEKNLRLTPAYRNLRLDHVICGGAYEMEFSAEALFWKFVVLPSPSLPGHVFLSRKEIIYYR